MNQQILSVLFCALLSSTLGHEYLRARDLTHKAKHHSRNANSVSHFRDNNQICIATCPVPQPPGSEGGHSSLQMVFNIKVSVVGVVNISASVAIAVDLQANQVVLFNGNTGLTILIDFKAQTLIRFAEGSDLWLASKISFREYLLALGSLTNIKNFPNGQSFQLNSVSKQVVTEIGVIISSLDSSLADRIKLNAQAALSIVIILSKTLIVTLGGPLSIFIQKVEADGIILRGGLVELVTLLKGMAELSTKIAGGFEAILAADIKFKLSLVLAAASGLEAFIALLAQVADKVDLSKVLGPLIKSPEAFLEAVVTLEQGMYNGLTGIVAVIYNVLLLVSNKISIPSFIDIIIQVGASGGSVSSERFTAVIDSVIQLMQTQVDKFQSSESWQALITFFNNIKAGKLAIGGIDISAIISLIIEAAGKVSLNLVVAILLKLSAVVGIAALLANLYLRLVFFIISGQGVVYVLKLIPSLNFSIDFSSGTSIIVQIFKAVRVVLIIPYIISLDVIGLIKHLPVFGAIHSEVEVVLNKTRGGMSDDLNSGIKESRIITIIFGWAKCGANMGGSPPTGSINGQIIIGGGASIDTEKSIAGSASAGQSSSTSSPNASEGVSGTTSGGTTSGGISVSGGTGGTTSGDVSVSGESSGSTSSSEGTSVSGSTGSSTSEGASVSGEAGGSTSGIVTASIGISGSTSGDTSITAGSSGTSSEDTSISSSTVSATSEGASVSGGADGSTSGGTSVSAGGSSTSSGGISVSGGTGGTTSGGGLVSGAFGGFGGGVRPRSRKHEGKTKKHQENRENHGKRDHHLRKKD